MKHSLSILHIMLSASATSAPYNEHALPSSSKHRVTICTYRGPSEPVPAQIASFAGDGSLGGFVRALRRACRDRDYDIVHVHAPHLGCLFLVIDWATGRRLLPRAVYTVHNSYVNYRLRNKLLLLLVFAFFPTLVFCSRSSRDSFAWPYSWLANRKSHLVRNGVNLARIDQLLSSISAPSPAEPFTVVVVGRLVEIKNPLGALAAFQQSQSHADRLIFVGDGPQRNRVLSESVRLGLADQVQVTGVIPRPTVYEKLAGATILVSASWGEGLPIAVLEAMACRCPVVLSDIPPHREIAQGADFIPLVPTDDPAALTREIRRFRDLPPAQRAEIGAKCRALVQERFSLQIMQQEYEQVYAQALDLRTPE